MGDMFKIMLVIAFMIVDLVFIFYRTRKQEPINEDDNSTPEIIENRFGNYCKECGNTIEAKHTYCDNCGKKVR
jgi:uncharacterized OB-fold protein